MLPFTRNDNSCSTGLLETSNQKNIPKFLVVRDELPANHQGRARMPIPQNWIIFFVEFSNTFDIYNFQQFAFIFP
ncbi:hypothetical protein OA07_18840 [Aphanizomenon flos-aquae 2012/KM1/D3]|nr:hypothetical protein OA07_18840 [Aphanizomenon flos-aquae 2012/KM1/D3]